MQLFSDKCTISTPFSLSNVVFWYSLPVTSPDSDDDNESWRHLKKFRLYKFPHCSYNDAKTCKHHIVKLCLGWSNLHSKSPHMDNKFSNFTFQESIDSFPKKNTKFLFRQFHAQLSVEIYLLRLRVCTPQRTSLAEEEGDEYRHGEDRGEEE